MISIHYPTCLWAFNPCELLGLLQHTAHEAALEDNSLQLVQTSRQLMLLFIWHMWNHFTMSYIGYQFAAGSNSWFWLSLLNPTWLEAGLCTRPSVPDCLYPFYLIQQERHGTDSVSQRVPVDTALKKSFLCHGVRLWKIIPPDITLGL